MAYNIRDLQGHWVRPPDQEMQPCPHACCRGRRTHPERLPVVLDRQHLRTLSEPELTRELYRYSNYTDTHPRAFGQVIAEFDRRENAEKAAARRKSRYRDKDTEYRDEVYRQALTAEAQTNGYMLNAAGRRAGVDPVTLFTGPEKRARKYASPELMRYWESNARPTRVSFFGSARDRRAAREGSRIY